MTDPGHDIERPYHAAYSWATLAVGDGFTLPADRSLNGLRTLASRIGKRLGRRFVVRTSREGEQPVIRCSRVS